MTQYKIPAGDTEILLKMFPDGIIAVDLETTGLSPLIDKIIEIGAIKVTSSGVEVFNELINPEIPIPQYTIDIHGITDDMVKEKQKIAEVLPLFMKFIGKLPLIAHNAKFDLGFIVFQMHQLNIDFQTNEVFCSIYQARKSIEGPENYKLKTLSDFLKIELLNHHRATDDALASLRIFAHCLTKINRKKIKGLYNIKDYKKINAIELPESLALLYQSLPGQEVILIKYKGGSMRNRWRAIKPVSVLPMPQGSILYAKCLHSDLYKSFSLKKVSDTKSVDENELKEILQ